MLPCEQAVRMIETLDVAVFQIRSQTTLNDRKSFLRVQNLARSTFGRYVYLEVGSHIGGTLFPHLIDPACQAATSVDPRPETQADERARLFRYNGNSTSRMIAGLSKSLSSDSMAKLTTIESDVSAVQTELVSGRATLALIDGEHTDTACFSDFLGVLPLMKLDCIICFHDANLIGDAIRNAERFLDYAGIAYQTAFLPDTVAVIGLGELAVAVRGGIGSHALNREAFLESSRRQLWSEIAQAHSGNTVPQATVSQSKVSELAQEIDRVRKTAQEGGARATRPISSRASWAPSSVRALADQIKRRFRRR